MAKKHYDEDWSLAVITDDNGRFYDGDWNLIARVDHQKIYDTEWNLVARISDDGEKLYDKHWNLVACLSDDGTKVYDAEWNLISRTIGDGEQAYGAARFGVAVKRATMAQGLVERETSGGSAGDFSSSGSGSEGDSGGGSGGGSGADGCGCIIAALFVCLVLGGIRELYKSVIGSAAEPETQSPVSSERSAFSLPLCPNARVIKMSIAGHAEDYLVLHEECWSGSVQFVEGSLPNDYPTISHVGDDKGEWFQFLFADGTVSPVIRTDEPPDGVYTPVFVGHRFQIRGTGRVKIIYELRNGPPAPEPSVTAAEARPDGELDYSTENRVETDSAPAPPEAETPRSEAPLGEAGNAPEAEEIIFVGTVLSSESEDGRVLVLVKTAGGRYAAFADTSSWSEVSGMSGGEPWSLEGKRVRVTGRECRGTLICITKIELLDE